MSRVPRRFASDTGADRSLMASSLTDSHMSRFAPLTNTYSSRLTLL